MNTHTGLTKEQLEDELKQRDRRIAELREEIDELRERNQTLREDAEEWQEQFEQWQEAFEMVPNDDGVMVWNADVAGGAEWQEKYVELLRDYNKLVSDYNLVVRICFDDGRLRDRGRSIAATEEQRRIVYESHDEGRSLRECAEDADVGLQTVRTLIGKIDGSDRTSRRLSKYPKLKVDRFRLAASKARQRTRDALPKALHEHNKKTTALLKEANK
jgi:FtsZ-binding cell division protein ZapB